MFASPTVARDSSAFALLPEAFSTAPRGLRAQKPHCDLLLQGVTLGGTAVVSTEHTYQL